MQLDTPPQQFHSPPVLAISIPKRVFNLVFFPQVWVSCGVSAQKLHVHSLLHYYILPFIFLPALTFLTIQNGLYTTYITKSPLMYVHELFFSFFIIIIFIFLHGLGRLSCSGIDALPYFPGASTISSPPRFVVEGLFRKSVVVHFFEMADPVLFVFGFHVLYSRDL